MASSSSSSGNRDAGQSSSDQDGNKSWALETRFFGIDPRILMDDVYNVGDDLICYGLDSLEGVLLRDYATRVVDNSKQRKGGSGPPQPQLIQDPGLTTEIKEGTDKLLSRVVDAHAQPGDKMQSYSQVAYFAIPKELERQVEAAIAERGPARLRQSAVTPALVRSEEDDKKVTAEMEALELELKKERKRTRALLKLHSLLSRRVPQAEAADQRLSEVIDKFRAIQQQVEGGSSSASSAGGESIEDALPAFLAEAQQLQELCERIVKTSAAASPSLPPSSSSSSSSVPAAAAAAPASSALGVSSAEEQVARSVGLGISAALGSSLIPTAASVGPGGVYPMSPSSSASSSSSSSHAAAPYVGYADLLRRAEREKTSINMGLGLSVGPGTSANLLQQQQQPPHHHHHPQVLSPPMPHDAASSSSSSLSATSGAGMGMGMGMGFNTTAAGGGVGEPGSSSLAGFNAPGGSMTMATEGGALGGLPSDRHLDLDMGMGVGAGMDLGLGAPALPLPSVAPLPIVEAAVGQPHHIPGAGLDDLPLPGGMGMGMGMGAPSSYGGYQGMPSVAAAVAARPSATAATIQSLQARVAKSIAAAASSASASTNPPGAHPEIPR